MARGKRVEEIAAELVLSPHTVVTHIRNARVALNARSTPHLVAKAILSGILEEQPLNPAPPHGGEEDVTP